MRRQMHQEDSRPAAQDRQPRAGDQEAEGRSRRSEYQTREGTEGAQQVQQQGEIPIYESILW